MKRFVWICFSKYLIIRKSLTYFDLFGDEALTMKYSALFWWFDNLLRNQIYYLKNLVYSIKSVILESDFHRGIRLAINYQEKLFLCVCYRQKRKNYFNLSFDELRNYRVPDPGTWSIKFLTCRPINFVQLQSCTFCRVGRHSSKSTTMKGVFDQWRRF